jgi:subtilisin family serine protease
MTAALHRSDSPHRGVSIRHKVRRALSITVVTALLTPALLLAQSVNLQHAKGAQKLQAALLQHMQQAQLKGPEDVSQTFRIMVSLQAPHTSQSMDYHSPQGRQLIQQQVQQAQNEVLQIRTRGKLTVLYRYQNVFGFSAIADREAILELIAMDYVVFVEELPVMKKMDVESHGLTHVDQMHAASYTGKGVTIAIIDDGIDSAHAAFGGEAVWPTAKILAGYDFADNDPDPRIDCVDQSHGTAVAGVAAGNGGGILGTAPDAQLVFLKVQSAANCGQSSLDGDVAAAIDWAVSHRDTYGIDIISMSLGSEGSHDATVCDQAQPLFRQAVDAAYAAGMIVLAASGNEAQTDAISHPACMSKVISVGAVYDADLGRVDFSNCSDPVTGADRVTCYSNSAEILDILAPSDCALTAQAGGGTMDCFRGTSSAAPFAAGVAASLLEAAAGQLNGDTMRQLLVNHGVAVSDDKSDWIKPRIDALASLQALDGDVQPPPAPCDDCEHMTGSLAGRGASKALPTETGYLSQSGDVEAWLSGPSNADFNLFLFYWNGLYWVEVDRSFGQTSEEHLRYNGLSGYYVWVVESNEGGGRYDFWFK